MITIPIISVEQDYNGYFESLLRQWYGEMIKEGLVPRAKTVTLTSGPYRAQAVRCALKGTHLHIDFYSALRNGFGLLPKSEVETIKRQFL